MSSGKKRNTRSKFFTKVDFFNVKSIENKGMMRNSSCALIHEKLNKVHIKKKIEEKNEEPFLFNSGLIKLKPFEEEHKSATNLPFVNKISPRSPARLKINPLRSGFSQLKNEDFNETMEDYILIKDNLIENKNIQLFCVFDGHGGPEVSSYCTEHYPTVLKNELLANPFSYVNALRESFIKMDAELKSNNNFNDIGCTATVVLIVGKLLYCANIGDSSCILSINGEAKKVSKDDNFKDVGELRRVQSLGFRVIDERLEGVLMVSRSFGDFSLKSRGLICNPHIYSRVIEDNMDYCVLCSDGVWDVLSPKEVYNIIRFSENKSNLNKVASEVVCEAVRNGSEDNISCVIIELKKRRSESPKKLNRGTKYMIDCKSLV